MSLRNLDKIFAPRTVAVVDSQNHRSAKGLAIVQNLAAGGFPGDIFPLIPGVASLHGIRTYDEWAKLPVVPDLAVICSPAAEVPLQLAACGERGTRGVIVLSHGFREAGEAGRLLEAKMRCEQRRFDGMRILGPNCQGLIVPESRLNASLAPTMPRQGRVGFLSQSGALCMSVLDWAMDAEIGFSHFVSLGNMLDVSMGDLIDYLGTVAATRSIMLYLESIPEARSFLSAARAFTRTKPIVAFKAGRYAISTQAIASHTGAMVGIDAVYDAAFRRAGIERITDIDDMFDCSELLSRPRIPSSDRLAIITNAGGFGVMSSDALVARGGRMAQLSAQTSKALKKLLPPGSSIQNPLDITDDAAATHFARALDITLNDPGVDAALVIITPMASIDPRTTADMVAQAAQRTTKPVLAAWMGRRSVQESLRALNARGVATFRTPDKAINAFMHLVSYARNRTTLYETPHEVPLEFSLDRTKMHDALRTLHAAQSEVLSEIDSKTILASYDIPVTQPLFAATADVAVKHAKRLGYPVVIKIESPQIAHKSDVDGVVLNIVAEDGVRRAFTEVTERAAQLQPEAIIRGVTVQSMVARPNSYELILGAERDPVFGPVILLGMGGIATEVYNDRALGLPPLNEPLVRQMLESLRCWPLLQGYRGKPAVRVDRLIEIVMRFSYLIADCPEISEVDINPLLATPQDVLALDARIVCDPLAASKVDRPYAHLAIRPYPEEYICQRTLPDGTEVTLRPIKPEDEPAWHAMLAACSPETLHLRFNYLFKRTTHEMAARYCFTDYDRELGIVAEVEEKGTRSLMGIGRLVADADHRTAEYAVLVIDRWQGCGLGSVMTKYAIEIAPRWGVSQIVAEVAKDNSRMLAAFRSRGFVVSPSDEPDVLMVTREVS